MSNYSASKLENDNPNSSWYKTRNLIPDESLVLDVGCSSGNFGEELIKTKNCTVDGIEVDASDAALAQKKLRKVSVLNIETDSGQINSTYDVIFFGDVIEHLVHPVETLHSIQKLLKPKGSIVFSIPNMSHMLVRLAVMRGKFGYGETGLLDNTHLHYYTIAEVKRIFADAGYDIEQLDFVRRDVPLDVINEQLASIGLEANKKFEKIAQDIDAAAYQIIGRAVVATKKASHSKLPSVYPRVDEMHVHLESLKKLHQEDTERVEAHYKRLIKLQEEEMSNRTTIRRVKRKAVAIKQKITGVKD